MSATIEPRNATDPMLVVAAAFDAAAVGAATARTSEVFLSGVLPRFASLVGAGSCAIFLAGDGGMQCVAAVGLPSGYVSGARMASCPVAWSESPSVIADARTLAVVAPQGMLVRAHGFQSCWSVPLAVLDGAAAAVFVAFGRDREPPSPGAVELACAYGSVIALGLDRLRQHSGLAARSEAVVRALTAALDARDDYTGRHSTETSNLALAVGRRLGMGRADLELLSQVAVLHDVGKLGIPTEVLLKPGPLDAHEQALMREHPAIGERILSGIPGLADVARAIRHEHERWDGGGYPDGLAGDQIPLASRIVFCCDAYNAMTSDRAYRPAMAAQDARRELREGAGTQFDPRVAQALLESLGDATPPPACSPSESLDRALSDQLSELAAEIGAHDLFVFRKVAERLYSHLGGIGRGAGWAGNIELDSGQERYLREAIDNGAPICIELAQTGRIIGPYYGRSAVIAPCSQDAVVVFGSPTDSLARACTNRASRLAERSRSLVVGVSPAKRLADELEVLAAVREITTVNAEDMPETLAAIAARARNALSAEFAAVATIPSAELEAPFGFDAGDWQPSDPDAPARALARFTARARELPMLCQDLSELEDAPEGFRHEDGVSSMHVLAIGSPPVAVLLVVHAHPGLRGFTALCQRVASAMSDAAEVVVRRGIAQQRLRLENARLAEQLSTDPLTAVASRSAWDQALRDQELNHEREPLPTSVVIVDVDGLKAVNDQHGHAAGDELLRRCARLLAESARETEVVARIGGDEFAVLLRDTNLEQAHAFSRRLTAKLAKSAGPGPLLHFSIGCACAAPHDTIAATVAAADREMYKMKSCSRDARS
ncbi:MAG: HD domain-containing phosphohydrolase [Solirubrobacteraceae bacterium]